MSNLSAKQRFIQEAIISRSSSSSSEEADSDQSSEYVQRSTSKQSERFLGSNLALPSKPEPLQIPVRRGTAQVPAPTFGQKLSFKSPKKSRKQTGLDGQSQVSDNSHQRVRLVTSKTKRKKFGQANDGMSDIILPPSATSRIAASPRGSPFSQLGQRAATNQLALQTKKTMKTANEQPDGASQADASPKYLPGGEIVQAPSAHQSFHRSYFELNQQKLANLYKRRASRVSSPQHSHQGFPQGSFHGSHFGQDSMRMHSQSQHDDSMVGLHDLKQVDPYMKEIDRRHQEYIRSAYVKAPTDEHPLVSFIRDYVVISTSSVVYQSWKLLMILCSFLSSFYYAFAASTYHQMDNAQERMFQILSTSFEILFLVDMILKFFVEFHYEGEQRERDIRQLARIYLRSGFAFDFITLIPFELLLHKWISKEYIRLILLLKLIRLINGFHLLNYKVMMRELKQFQSQRLQSLIAASKPEADSQLKDQTHITLMLFIKYFLQAVYLIFVLISLSYLTGMFWWVYCDLPFSEEGEGFNAQFQIELKPFSHRVVLVLYFMFTTLSTVGLGDFHPTNSKERVFGAIILLFGVLVTSFVMENFIVMIKRLRTVGDSFEQSDQLSLFLTTLKRFNSNSSLSPDHAQRIEDYFAYRWKHDKNFAIRTNEEQELLEQLPEGVQQQIYSAYLYKDLVSVYHSILQPRKEVVGTPLQKLLGKLKVKLSSQMETSFLKDQAHVAWNSDTFKKFIVGILSMLEPAFFEEQEVIFNTGDEVSQALFFTTGTLEVGYDMELFDNESFCGPVGSNSSFPVALAPGQFIPGLFELYFDMPADFIYRAGRSLKREDQDEAKRIDGYFIRRSNWYSVMDDPSLQVAVKGFKTKILMTYIQKVYFPVTQEQKMVEQFNFDNTQMDLPDYLQMKKQIDQRLSQYRRKLQPKQRLTEKNLFKATITMTKQQRRERTNTVAINPQEAARLRQALRPCAGSSANQSRRPSMRLRAQFSFLLKSRVQPDNKSSLSFYRDDEMVGLLFDQLGCSLSMMSSSEDEASGSDSDDSSLEGPSKRKSSKIEFEDCDSPSPDIKFTRTISGDEERDRGKPLSLTLDQIEAALDISEMRFSRVLDNYDSLQDNFRKCLRMLEASDHQLQLAEEKIKDQSSSIVQLIVENKKLKSKLDRLADAKKQKPYSRFNTPKKSKEGSDISLTSKKSKNSKHSGLVHPSMIKLNFSNAPVQNREHFSFSKKEPLQTTDLFMNSSRIVQNPEPDPLEVEYQKIVKATSEMNMRDDLSNNTSFAGRSRIWKDEVIQYNESQVPNGSDEFLDRLSEELRKEEEEMRRIRTKMSYLTNFRATNSDISKKYTAERKKETARGDSGRGQTTKNLVSSPQIPKIPRKQIRPQQSCRTDSMKPPRFQILSPTRAKAQPIHSGTMISGVSAIESPKVPPSNQAAVATNPSNEKQPSYSKPKLQLKQGHKYNSQMALEQQNAPIEERPSQPPLHMPTTQNPSTPRNEGGLDQTEQTIHEEIFLGTPQNLSSRPSSGGIESNTIRTMIENQSVDSTPIS